MAGNEFEGVEDRLWDAERCLERATRAEKHAKRGDYVGDTQALIA
jgi:hypothetical protein